MKKILFALSFLFASYASANPAYTLNQVCSVYGASAHVCSSIPFCEALLIPAQSPGCHAKPDSSYAEPLCVGFDPSLCNPDTTACYMSNVLRPAQTACRANRNQL